MTTILPVAACAVLVLAVPLVTSQGRRLVATWLASPFQLYLPGLAVAGFHPPLALLAALSLWPEIRRSGSLLRWPPTLFLLLLGLCLAISLLWSPDPRRGFRAILYLGLFLLVVSSTRSVDRASRIDVARHWPWLAAPLVLEALVVIAFALSPSLEARFMTSEAARLFINPNTLDLDELTTWSDPVKSGGLVINANVAAAWLGMAAVSTGAIAFAFGRPALYGVAALLWISVFFAGSKAASALAAVVPVVGWGLLAARRALGRRRLVGLAAAHLAASLALLAATNPVVLQKVAGSLPGIPVPGQEPQEGPGGPSLGDRPRLWRFGWTLVKENPVRGLGFGGWETAVRESRVTWHVMPPLNTVLDLWVKGGLFAAAFGVAFAVSLLRFGWTAYRRAGEREHLGLSIGLLLAFLWMFVQGMVENFGLLGDVHIYPVAAAALGLVRSRCEAKPVETDA